MTPVCHQSRRCMTFVSSEARCGYPSSAAPEARRPDRPDFGDDDQAPRLLCWLIDVSAPKHIVRPADTEPPIAVALNHDPMLAVLVGVAVLFPQQIDEELALLGMLFLESDRKRDLARLSIKIVHAQHPIVATVIPLDEDCWVAARDYREVAPAHLGDFLAHADDPFGPVQQRVWMPALDRGVDVLKTVGAARDDRNMRLVALGEAAVW